MATKKETITMPVFEGDQAGEWIRAVLGRSGGSRGKTFDEAKNEKVRQAVADIIATVARDGDAGLKAIANRLGDKAPQKVVLTADLKAALEERLCDDTKSVLNAAAANIKKFGDGVISACKAVSVDFSEYWLI